MGKSHSKDRRARRSSQKSSQDGIVTMSGSKQLPPAHSDAVTCLAPVTPGLCLTGSSDKTVVLYDWTHGAVKRRWSAHTREVTKVAYSAGLDAAFSASRDKTVLMWKLSSIETNPIRAFRGHTMVVMGLTLNPDNTQVCTGSRDNSLRLWDVETGACLMENSVPRNLVTDICWVPGQQTVVQTGEDKVLKLWDARGLYVSCTFPQKQYIQTSCDVSRDGNYCITTSNGFGGQGCEATLWDVRAVKAVCEYRGHRETASACAFLPAVLSQPLVATASHDCTVRIWDQNTQDCLCVQTLPVSGPLTSLAGFEDASLCCSSFNTGVHLFHLDVTPEQKVNLIRKAQF
ncbi:PREDICTED: WD repeat-containing protein 31-like [Branchiostoma belcheri]|uniref:WD repeat-containing protein 31-like n=1 Tax=Branchiostoma belcheri TaxID=7741 RepID=A0A6P4ZIK5_BRABE|nr:PREDICTED: WD repeat-containing protein 31-like [Branchiostoma belcheri]